VEYLSTHRQPMVRDRHSYLISQPLTPPMTSSPVKHFFLQTFCCSTLVLLTSLWFSTGHVLATEPTTFEQQVVPILEKHCYTCHSIEDENGGLRLDSRKNSLIGGDSGNPAIVPGKPAESDLLKRILTTDEDEQMPPEGEGERLSEQEIAILTSWIKSGADWPDELSGDNENEEVHWAFLPPVRPELPEVTQPGWGQNEIDRFILHRLDQEQLSPSVTADKTTNRRH